MGGGSSAPSQPSTTTQIADIPEWERPYVEDLLGQAQAVAAQPYQQFSGPKIAGFTPDQMQAFSNVQGAGATNQANQAAAFGAAGQGADTANNIYNAGAGYTQAATGYNPLAAVAPYLGAASQYNAASASQPWLNQAANYQGAAAQAGTPQGIQSYMSPYTNSVVQGIQNQANQNWTQNIMPGVNDKFVGSGQYGSGRNAQVLGQAADNFQTGLSANVANALESGYNTAGQQAGQQASLLAGLGGQALTGANTAGGMQTAQIGNLLNQAGAAGTATQQQAANLQGTGAQLGNLANTQASAQLASGKVLGDLGNQAATTNLAQNTALQGVGQQQQQLEQSNLNTALADWQAQVDFPKTQTDYLSGIIHGLPATGYENTKVTQQSPAYTGSPLAGVGSSITNLLGNLSSTQGQKEGGLVGYAKGGLARKDNLDTESLDDIDPELAYDLSPLDMASLDAGPPNSSANDNVASALDAGNPLSGLQGNNSKNSNNPLSAESQAPNPLDMAAASDTPDTQTVPATAARQQAPNPLAPQQSSSVPLPSAEIPEGNQQDQLLAMARAMAYPGSEEARIAQGSIDARNVGKQEYAQRLAQNELAYQRQQDAAKMGLESRKYDIEQTKADAMNAFREAGGAQQNRVVSVVGPDGKTMYVTAKEAMDKGYSPAANYNALNSSLSPEALDKAADGIASGLHMNDVGVGYGQAGDRKAIMARVAEKYPNLKIKDSQLQLVGDKSAARTIGTSGGKIELAANSLESMIPLARKASEDLDRSQYPTINSIQNAVEKGTGDTKIIALNTYLNAVIADQAALFVRSGQSTDSARAKAEQMANAALSNGQLNTYFDSVENEIKAQRGAIKNSNAAFKSSSGAGASADDALAAKRAAVLAARVQGGQ